MQTCKALLFLTAGLGLAGCDTGLGIGVSRQAPEQIRLADGMVVAGAEGWCVDTITTRSDDDAAVVVLGSCAALAENVRAPSPDVPGLVTVSVDSDDGGAAPTADQLESFFGTDAGRAALARDGRAESVEILETRRREDLLILRAEDRSAAPGTDPEVWRALFDLEGRFISVSLYGLEDQPIESEDGLATLSEQVATLRAVNATP